MSIVAMPDESAGIREETRKNTINQVAIRSLIAAVFVFFIGYRVGYWAAPKEILDSEVTAEGTKRVLAATVESLKAESKLVSYSYKGTASVDITKDRWIVFQGHQTLIVPATVSYFVDLSLLQESDVTFDETKQAVWVNLPPLKLDVSFDPEHAIEINEGTLTLSDDVVQELRKLNYETARKAIIKQAQQAELVRLAREQATKNVTSYFAIPLHAVGKDDVQVRVAFGSDSRRRPAMKEHPSEPQP